MLRESFSLPATELGSALRITKLFGTELYDSTLLTLYQILDLQMSLKFSMLSFIFTMVSFEMQKLFKLDVVPFVYFCLNN